MAVTIAVVKRSVEGNRQTVYADVTGPASYTTGGEDLSQSDLNKLLARPGGKIGEVTFFAAEDSTGGHALVLDRANSKVLYFNGTTQIAATTNLSAVTARVAVSSVVNG